MSGMIKVGGNSSGISNLTVKELRLDGKVTSSSFNIKYKVENFKTLNLKHYIYI